MEPTIFYPESTAHWRNWLQENHLLTNSVWLVFYRKASGRKSLSWSDAVDVALCFGWIDSKKVKIDVHTFHQFFSKRRPRSTWSAINKQKIARLKVSNLIEKAGYEAIEVAQLNGSWNLLDEVDALVIPKDLETAFKLVSGTESYFLSLSKSSRKAILHWLVLARQKHTREKRILEIVSCAAEKKKPKLF